jgi:uncharacterized membrane protein YphA (DoxX/SURF4 family)
MGGPVRFVSAYPDRWPGRALLLLRVVVGMTAAAQGLTLIAGDPTPAMWVGGLAAIVSGSLLLVGLLTPGAAALAGISLVPVVFAMFPPPASGPFIDRVGAACVAAAAAALVPLGPGSLSIDARLFGRREIVFPHDPD